MRAYWLPIGLALGGFLFNTSATSVASPVPAATMQAVFDEAKTPFDYGVVLNPPAGAQVDSPRVFRHGDKWYMTYALRAHDSSTEIASSDDLLHWTSLGTILIPGADGKWDATAAIGGIALFNPEWGADNEPQKFKNQYWLCYYGGPGAATDLGTAISPDPAKSVPWKKFPLPVLRHSDTNARPFETGSIAAADIISVPSNVLGMPFLLFYRGKSGSNNADAGIGLAVSHNLRNWKRIGNGPILSTPLLQTGTNSFAASGFQVVHFHDSWVLFHALTGTNSGTTFAISQDLTNWVNWQGPPLTPTNATRHAGSPWFIKDKKVVYQFYSVPTGTNSEWAIALATSKDVRASEPAASRGN